MSQPFIVGIGGTAREGSSTEAAMRFALASVKEAGGRTCIFGGADLAALPHYLAPGACGSPIGQALIAAIRQADGVLVASPGYHGSVSGIVKNALDYLEETARDARRYLHGLPVGLIVTAYGWQATGSTLAALRAITHALRGWPTPLGVTINSATCRFAEGSCDDAAVADQLTLVAQQVLSFAALRCGISDAQGSRKSCAASAPDASLPS